MRSVVRNVLQISVSASLLCILQTVGLTAPPIEVDHSTQFRVELTTGSPIGEASIREHSIVWHPERAKYYLVADVIPLSHSQHPNTYDTQLHLWSSGDLMEWTYHGIAVEKGVPNSSYDGYGVASPAGMAFFRGQFYVPFSARRTDQFTKRSVSLAISGENPEKLPWTKTISPVSDLPGEDDDPALLAIPGDESLHLFHRRTGPGGYRIVHTATKTPNAPDSWPAAQTVTSRPPKVRVQELTGVFVKDDVIHLLVIEHFVTGGMRIAHLISDKPSGPFEPTDLEQRYLPSKTQPRHLAFGGHITPVVRNGSPVAFFWTVPQEGARYGLQGHPVRVPNVRSSDASKLHGNELTDEKVVAEFTKSTLDLADGGRMNCYLRQGIGPTLVLVPGTWGGLWRFQSLIAELPSTIGIAVVELRWQAGHKPPSLDMTMEQIADDVLKAIETMKLKRFVVSGHSIGGMIAVEIAGREVPGLVGAIPMEGWTNHTVVKNAFGGVVVSNLTSEEETRRQADRVQGRRHLSDKELQAIGTIWRRWDGYGCLERSTIPVLEIWGDRGKPRPSRESLRVPNRDNIEIAWITDASHLVLLEDSAEVARLVLNFLKKNN